MTADSYEAFDLPDGPGKDEIRDLITQLVAETSDPWNEAADLRADAIAEYFQLERWLQWLVGTCYCNVGLDLWAAEASAPVMVDYDLMQRAHRLARDAWTSHFAGQVVLGAATVTDVRRIFEFQGRLRQSLWSEMVGLARRSTGYLVRLSQIEHDQPASQGLGARFDKLTDIQRVEAPRDR
jgi:hypothetical protein